MGQITRTNFGCVKTVELSNADILTLPTVAFTIVPALGTGRAIVPCSFGAGVVAVQCFCAVDYGNINVAVQMHVSVGGTPPLSGTGIDTGYGQGSVTTQLLTPVASGWVGGRVIYVPPAYDAATANGLTDVAPTMLSGIENAPLLFWMSNAGVNFNGGDPANKMIITAYYSVIEIEI